MSSFFFLPLMAIMVLIVFLVGIFFLGASRKETLALTTLPPLEWIDPQELSTIFPDTHFTLWNGYYVLVYDAPRFCICATEKNHGYFKIQDAYLPFWRDTIHPWILLKNPRMKKYYFMFSTMDGPYTNTPRCRGKPTLMLQPPLSLEIFKAQKQGSPCLFPVLHPHQKIGCFSMHRRDPIALPLLDPEFVLTRGHLENRQWIDRMNTPWEKRIDKMVFRGNLGNGSVYNYGDTVPTTTTATSKTPRQYFVDEVAPQFPEDIDVGKDDKSVVQMCQYRYQMDIDGHSNAWSAMFWKLYSGSVVLKQESEWEQWYYRHLKPYVHYVPVRPDFSNLGEQLQWCRYHPEQCKKIAENAKQFVRKRLSWDQAVHDMQNMLWKEYFLPNFYLKEHGSRDKIGC